MLEKLRIISKVTGSKFGMKREGKVFDVLTGAEIPERHLFIPNLKQRDPYREQYFNLSAYTCGGRCEIGTPAPACVAKGCYQNRSCARYVPHKLSALISLKGCIKIMEEYRKEGS
jgi:hypothetical protein